MPTDQAIVKLIEFESFLKEQSFEILKTNLYTKQTTIYSIWNWLNTLSVSYLEQQFYILRWPCKISLEIVGNFIDLVAILYIYLLNRL